MREWSMPRDGVENLFGGRAWRERTAANELGDLVSRNRALEAEIERTRRVAQRLQAERDQAVEAERAKSLFLATMSHDLRTPLTVILGFSEVMMQGVFGPIDHPRYQTYVENIHAGGQLLLDLINNILDLSKIEAGRRLLARLPLDGGAIAADCLELVTRASRERRITTEIHVEGDGRVYADELALRRILINLLSNAMKFTADGGRVELTIADDPAGGTRVIVADTGIGMDAAGVKTALEPFGQVAGPDRRDGSGTGLGLPIAVRLVGLHGGTFAIDSAPGRGTRISLWLPPSGRADA
jgi:two-component system cell cycle sensor histidine kinase PleC